ncbi:MAG TPA: hypothetical protein VMF90_03110 [Rhizobiaceae bacterium]|nr:hypothetical protein [Rhizobiaceae bacterium]
MRTLFLAAAACLALAGCTTGPVDGESQLARICRQATAATTAINLASLFVTIPPDAKSVIDQAKAVLEPACENPDQTTTPAMLRKAAKALERLEAARAAAK